MEANEVHGGIHISYSIYCPFCGHYHDDHYDREWFEEVVGGDFPCDQSDYDVTYKANCKECHQDFIIKGFRH